MNATERFPEGEDTVAGGCSVFVQAMKRVGKRRRGRAGGFMV